MKFRIPWDTELFFVLLTLSLFLISSYALINSPAPLEKYIIEVLDINTYKYGVLVSLCPWASLLDILHGYLLDRYIGIVLATWSYAVMVFIGCILYSISGFTRTYWLMISGRLIFGLGVNPMMLLVNKHIIHWFGKGKHVNFIYSFCESIFWLGSSIVFLVSVPILEGLHKSVSKEKAFAITNAGEITFFCLLTVVPMLVVAYMHRSKSGGSEIVKRNLSQSETSIVSSADSEKKRKDLKFTDYVCLPFVFWMFALSVFLFYVSILSFMSMSVLYFTTNYVDVSTNYASSLSGLITLIAAVVSPFYGLVIDRIGHNLTSLTLAVMLSALALGLLTWTMCTPLIPAILMGLSLVASSGLWSQFQFLVEEHQYMIAYGVAQTGLNGAQAVGTMIAGFIINHHGYNAFMIFLFSVIACAIPLLATVWVLDIRRNNFMNMTSTKKNKILGRVGSERRSTEENKCVDNQAYSINDVA